MWLKESKYSYVASALRKSRVASPALACDYHLNWKARVLNLQEAERTPGLEGAMKKSHPYVPRDQTRAVQPVTKRLVA